MDSCKKFLFYKLSIVFKNLINSRQFILKVSGKNSNYVIGLIKIKIGGVKVAYRF